MIASERTTDIIDSHQHFWRLTRGDYGWLNPEHTALYRDFEPGHLAPILDDLGIARSILVQAAPTVAETRFLLSLAQQHDFIGAVVGWVDFENGDAGSVLDELCRHPKFAGVRPMIQDLPDPDWLSRPNIRPGVAALIERGLTFDALIKPQHLRSLIRFCEEHPALTVVLDHAAKPDIAAGAFDRWAADLRDLARHTSVRCKLSGLVTEARAARPDALARYVDHLLESFGPRRIMWGSDWPVCESVCSYREWFDLSDRLLSALGPSERANIFGAVACETYGLDKRQAGRPSREAAGETMPALLLLHPDDNVFVARRNLASGESVAVDGREMRMHAAIPLGHKVARFRLSSGSVVVKHGAPIGSTSGAVAAGEHLHLHNMKSDYLPPHTRQARTADPS